MKDFARLQAEFQRAIVDGDETVLGDILDSPREKRDVLFNVYKYAYGSRLVDSMRKDHALLHLYVGDELFDEIGAAYVAAHPSQQPSIRWFARDLPVFLAKTEPYSQHQVLSELALLEKTLNDAFDAADGPVLTMAEMGAIPPETWQDLTFTPHGSVRRLNFATNASAVWAALRQDEMAPEGGALAEREQLVVWREDTVPMLRPLSAEEAMMWDEAVAAIPFGQLCAMLATYDDPDNAAARAAGYLGGWINAGMLAGAAPDTK